MVRKLFALMVGIVALSMVATAEEKKAEKKVELTGKLVCTKCELKETKACGNAFLVTDKDKKEVKYYIVDKGAKEAYHAACCQAPADAKVTGTIVEKKVGDKTVLTITEAKVDVKK